MISTTENHAGPGRHWADVLVEDMVAAAYEKAPDSVTAKKRVLNSIHGAMWRRFLVGDFDEAGRLRRVITDLSPDRIAVANFITGIDENIITELTEITVQRFRASPHLILDNLKLIQAIHKAIHLFLLTQGSGPVGSAERCRRAGKVGQGRLNHVTLLAILTRFWLSAHVQRRQIVLAPWLIVGNISKLVRPLWPQANLQAAAL